MGKTTRKLDLRVLFVCLFCFICFTLIHFEFAQHDLVSVFNTMDQNILEIFIATVGSDSFQHNSFMMTHSVPLQSVHLVKNLAVIDVKCTLNTKQSGWSKYHQYTPRFQTISSPHSYYR